MKRALNIIMLLVIILSTSYTISEEQEYIPLPDELYQNDGSQYLVLPENYDENITEKSKPYRLLIIGVIRICRLFAEGAIPWCWLYLMHSAAALN